MDSVRTNGVHNFPFPVHDVIMIIGLLPIFLHNCKIKSGSDLGMRLLLDVKGVVHM